MNICFYETFFTLTKVAYPKSALAFLYFNHTTWSLHPSHSAQHFNYFSVYYIIIIENCCYACVFYFCIFRSKLCLIGATHFVIQKVLLNRQLNILHQRYKKALETCNFSNNYTLLIFYRCNKFDTINVSFIFHSEVLFCAAIYMF